MKRFATRSPRCVVAATTVATALMLSVSGRAQTDLTAEFVAQLTTRAQELYDVVGLQLVVIQDGEVLAEAAAGERAAGQPMTPASLTNIASCSKAFTAAAIALLVQDGKLGWDDAVIDHVPEFRMADPWITRNMTVRDLLSHRCGLKTFAGDLLWYGSDYDDQAVLARLHHLPITQPFRGQFGYQNLMYMVAGLVIERTGGTSWDEFVEQRFFAPLGMQASRSAAQRLPADAERAVPHIDGEPIEDHQFRAVRPAASIYSSVTDLTPWMRMLLAEGKHGEKQMLSAQSLAEMWRPHIPIGRGTGANAGDFYSYGLGWFLSLDRGKKVVEHDGGMPGFLSKVSLMPAENFGFAVLNNSNDGVVNEAIKRAIYGQRSGRDGMKELVRIAAIAKRLKRMHENEVKQREAKRKPDTSPTLALGDYTGRYVDESYGPAEVKLDGDQLHVTLLPSKRKLFGKLTHWHHDTFRVDFPDKFLPFALFRFDFDHDGKVAGFRIDCPIADFDFGALDFRLAK
ncbi:MAG: serine hydrolase [bacterium]|nr:serine hydrolase [bacterium]